jgi:Fic family protein
MKNEIELSNLPIIDKIEALKSEIDGLRPLEKEQEDRIMQKLRLDWNYHSNAIEGNSLNYGETVAFLMHGVTAKGKPLKDYLDIRGHNEAIEFLMTLIKSDNELTEADIRSIHSMILVEPYEVDAITQDGNKTKRRISLGSYKTMPNHVRTATGEMHYYATPQETPIKMHDLMEWYKSAKQNTDIHPLVIAAIFHHKFVEIHPFDDGNGRLARLLMNLILMQNHFQPAVIRQNDRSNYYSTLSQADAGDLEPFTEYIGEALVHSMEIYLKGATGESIEEPDDLDKELLLFKKELEGKEEKLKIERSIDVQIELYNYSFKELIFGLNNLISKFKDMFLTVEESLITKNSGFPA